MPDKERVLMLAYMEFEGLSYTEETDISKIMRACKGEKHPKHACGFYVQGVLFTDFYDLFYWVEETGKRLI